MTSVEDGLNILFWLNNSQFYAPEEPNADAPPLHNSKDAENTFKIVQICIWMNNLCSLKVISILNESWSENEELT